MKLIAAALLFFVVFFSKDIKAQDSTNLKVIAYFHGGEQQLDSVDVNKLTHIIFCFGHLDGSKLKIDDARDSALIQKMVLLKQKNPELKVILSLGGWGGCETCSDAFFTEKGRTEFSESVKQINDYFKTDGIDLDWEYPAVRLDNDIDQNPVHKAVPEDRANFTDLVRKLRTTLGDSMIVSFAAGGFNTYLQKAVEWKEVMKEVDFVNLMSYDLINGYSTTTGHHTALYSTGSQRESTDNAVQYLKSIGVDPGQIVIGAAFYARIWENVPPANNGLYQQGKFLESYPYKYFPQRLSISKGYKYFWDQKASAPYMYSAAEKKFATFDDQRSIEVKTKYAIDQKLGGIMFWEITHDLGNHVLLNTIYSTKEKLKK